MNYHFLIKDEGLLFSKCPCRRDLWCGIQLDEHNDMKDCVSLYQRGCPFQPIPEGYKLIGTCKECLFNNHCALQEYLPEMINPDDFGCIEFEAKNE